VVAVICDNVIIHRSKLVNRWLAAHPRMRVLHGARYSPHDNPTERIWGALKAWLANNPTLTIQGRVRQVHAFFRERSPAQLLATAAPHSSPWLPEDYVQDFREAAYYRLPVPACMWRDPTTRVQDSRSAPIGLRVRVCHRQEPTWMAPPCRVL
jgi:hypothetical protein